MNANSISVGSVIRHKGNLWLVVKKDHVKPGKGGAFAQMELKGITTNAKVVERFRATEDVEKMFMEDKDYQYQYMDGDNLALMDMETYEQELLPKDLLGDMLPYLQDEMNVKVQFCEGKPLSIKLPEHVTLEVVETEAVVKGQTAASSYKPAILENGVRVMVPPFITTGTKVVVRTSDSEYIERAK